MMTRNEKEKRTCLRKSNNDVMIYEENLSALRTYVQKKLFIFKDYFRLFYFMEKFQC